MNYKPINWYDEDVETPYQPSMTVIDDETAPVFTGLYDHHGTPLYRVPDKVQIGFVKR